MPSETDPSKSASLPGASGVPSHAADASHLRAWSALVLVQFLFGALPAVSKFAVAELSPLSIVISRSLTATAVFLLLRFLRERNAGGKAAAKLPWRLHLRLGALGVLGVSLNQIFLFYALRKTTAAAAAILSPSISIFTLLISLSLGREKFGWAKLANIALGAAGVAWLFLPSLGGTVGRPGGSGQDTVLGNLMCLASALCYASYLALSPPTLSRVGTIRFSSLVFAYATGFNLVVYFVTSGTAPWEVPAALIAGIPEISMGAWFALGYLVVGTTILTYLLNAFALGTLPPGVVGGLVCAQTIIGVWLSRTLVGEAIPVAYYMAMALVLTGVLVLWGSNMREYRRKKASLGQG